MLELAVFVDRFCSAVNKPQFPATLEAVRILAIESSCDETAAAVVEDGETVLSSVVASQMVIHGKYGGVVPELASREHLRAIVPVVREALEALRHRLGDLTAIAATVGPGLVGSLLVGLTYAKSLSFASGVPLIAVNHIEGHIHAVILEAAPRGNARGIPRAGTGGERRTHAPVRSARGIRVPPARQDARRRRRRGLRQGGQAARLRLPRRPDDRPPGAPRQTRPRYASPSPK